MTLIVWHNPRCSKSRQALALLEKHGITPEIRRYLDTPPSAAELREVLGFLGRPAGDLVRKGEAQFRALGLGPESGEDDLIAAMAAHPILIERPVAILGDRAVIGRPPETVLDLL